MNVCVIGTGYVGLVTGACFAEFGVNVICADKDEAKIDMLERGEIPIYEPGLESIVQSNHASGRLDFTTEGAPAIVEPTAIDLWPNTWEGRAVPFLLRNPGRPLVLFVHGFPSFWYAWADQLEAFRDCRRVIAIDAPGAGLSDRPPTDEGYRVPALAARLDQLIADLAPDERITLVGHDWGGALAWSYAEWQPQRLERPAVFRRPPDDLFPEPAPASPGPLPLPPTGPSRSGRR